MARGKRKPKPGDLIEVKRPCYQHWALYLGDGYVINVAPGDEGAPALSVSIESVITRKAKVKKQLLTEVVGNDEWNVNNKYDRSRTPLPVAEIIRRAKRYIDREVSYTLLGNNCEHFVTMLRYGKKVSHQATKAVAIITAVEVGLFCASSTAALVINIPLVVGYFGLHAVYKLARLFGKRRVVQKSSEHGREPWHIGSSCPAFVTTVTKAY